MIKEAASQYDPKTIEKNIQAFWEEIDAYSKVRLLRRGGKKFFFVDGPPYTTGRIHLGTAWNKVIKDSILRYKSMKGYHVLDRAGWDMHGLPIEVKVEGVLGFKSKKDIETFGVNNFVAKCKEFALQHKEEMTLQFQNLGVWLNWKDPYMTLRDEYIEAAWWTLKQAQEQGLLEKGKRVVNWCPRCETAIADSEVEYWDETDPAIYVKFKVVGEEDTYIVIWTTTPWTLPANIAVAVHPSFEYSKVKARKNSREEILIMARELVENVMKQGGYKEYGVVESMLGEDLKIEYEHPLQDKIPEQKAFSHSLYVADFVTAENTGCVHIAPGHGLDDFELGIKNKLPIFCPVGPDGNYTQEAGEYEGMHVREANQLILKDLEERGSLLAKDEISHRYGHCWRCKTPIIYLATEQWFLKVTELKDKMLEEINKVKWYPEWAGSSRFKDWVVGARDWCISRQRYWGIPLPIWICEDCKSMEVIATVEELKERSGLELADLHRPNVDSIQLKCSCGGLMTRVPDVFDVWFDSAVASWATLNFPREKRAFEEWWPADFITEGHDQTRGWFYSQLGASMIAFGKAPYKSVLMHGFTLDSLGRKMSKSLGNVVTPEEIVDKYGAEALRLYVLFQNAPWDDLRFSWEEVANIHRMLNILWNIYRFPLPYMILDKFDPMEISLESLKGALRPEDRWILSRAQTMIKKVGMEMDQYNLHRAVRKISEFIIEDLSRWYIQLIRPRTWREANDPDKLAAYKTLYEVLVQVTMTLAPFAPFTSETIYQNLVKNIDSHRPDSVHMCDWEAGRKELIDRDLEAKMDIIKEITEASSNARQKVKRKLRWPVRRIIIAPKKEEVVEAVKALEEVLKDQTNSKEVTLLGIGEEWKELGIEVVPNPSILGPIFKKDAAGIIDALKKTDGKVLKQKIEEKGSSEILGVSITKDMVAFREKIPENISNADFTGGMVYVDTQLTREIESEGYAREVIRRLQDMRKELDLAVEEEISAIAEIEDKRVTEMVNSWKEFIAGEIRAKLLVIDTDVEVKGELVKDWEVEGIKIKMGISR